MTQAESAAMSPDAIDTFLARAETGVVSLARDGEPYAVPVSYGYDTDSRRFYLRLVSGPDSTRARFLDGSPRARLVVYEGDGPAYRSVVATGELETLDPEALSPAEIAQYGDAKQPLFGLWDHGRADLDIDLYELRPEELTGRQTTVDRGER